MMNPSGQNEQKPNLISPNFAPLPQTVQFQANALNNNGTNNSISSTSSSPLTMLQKPNLSPQSINLSKALAKPPPLSSILTLPKNALLNANAPNLPNGSSGGGGGGLTPQLVTNSNSSSLSPSPSPFSLSLTQQHSSNLLASNKPTDSVQTAAANLSLSSSSIFKNNNQDQHHQQANNFSNSMPASTTAQLFPQATNTSNASQIFNRPSLTPAQPNLATNATVMAAQNQAATSQSPLAQFQNQSNSSLNSSSQSSLDQFNNSNSGMLNRMTNTKAAMATTSAAQFSTNLQQK